MAEYYQCRICKGQILVDDVSFEAKSRLIDIGVQGDAFFDVYCSKCASSISIKRDKLRTSINQSTGVLVTRPPLSWRQAVHLALFHLHTVAQNNKGYDEDLGTPVFFRWKEDICALLESHWDHLLFDKSPINNHWQSSVSSVLSSNPDIFIRGNEMHLKESGWWALRVVQPPSATSSLTTPSRKPPASSQANVVDKMALLKKLLREDQNLIRKALQADPDIKIGDSDHVVEKIRKSKITQSDSQKFERQRRLKQKGLSPGKHHLPVMEADILRKCQHICRKNDGSGVPPILRRLQRKIVNRWLKRKLNMRPLDLDMWMYEYLRQGDDTCLYVGEEPPIDLAIEKDPNRSMRSQNPKSDIIYIREPERSFKYKMLGMSSIFHPSSTLTLEAEDSTQWLERPLMSVFSGRIIPGFVCHVPQDQFRPLEMNLLEELGSNHKLGVVHMRRELVPQINRLMQQAFWPRIDVIEHCDWPEYTFVLMYRLRVVGLTLWQPDDGYLPFLWISTGWRGVGLGRWLFQLLLNAIDDSKDVGKKDITLHVAPDNPAIFLYQSLGFKIDRYVLGFYHKYLPPEMTGSRNAFFMRLKR